MHTIKFEKMGLSHTHIVMWLDNDNQLTTARDIDKVISVELPLAHLYLKLPKVV